MPVVNRVYYVMENSTEVKYMYIDVTLYPQKAITRYMAVNMDPL